MSALFKATRRSASGQKLLRATSMSLMLLLLGCSASSQGPKGTGPVDSHLIAFYEPGAQIRVTITSPGHLNGWSWGLAPNAAFNNDPCRPAGIPSSYIAYVSGGRILDPTHEYYGDLEGLSGWDPDNWQHVDDVDSFTGGFVLTLIH